MRISFGFAALIIVLNTLPAGAEPGKSQSQTQVQRQAATGTKPNNQNAHFLREGEVGYGTRLLKVPELPAACTSWSNSGPERIGCW